MAQQSPREGHPLKEGLRLLIVGEDGHITLPREGHPLKEGLRHNKLTLRTNPIITQRGSSIKRGIKTHILNLLWVEPFRPRKGHPLKEGLRLLILLQLLLMFSYPERVIH